MNIIKDKYKILRKIGSGGQSEVYLAEVNKKEFGFSKKLAIKFFEKNDTNKKSFLSEAKILSTLHHPNISQILDVQETKDQFFIVLEFIEGIDLKNLIRKMREKKLKLNTQAVAQIGLHILRALKYIHEHRKGPFFHKDVSPHNVLIDRYGNSKLIDFGISNNHKENKASIEGKPKYLPSNYLNGNETYTASIDIYGLGISLLELTLAEDFKGFENKLIDDINSNELKLIIESLINFNGDYKTVENRLNDLARSDTSNLESILALTLDSKIISENTVVDTDVHRKTLNNQRRNKKQLIWASIFLLALIISGIIYRNFFSSNHNLDKFSKKFLVLVDNNKNLAGLVYPRRSDTNYIDHPKSFYNESCRHYCEDEMLMLTYLHSSSSNYFGSLDHEYVIDKKIRMSSFENFKTKGFSEIVERYTSVIDQAKENEKYCSQISACKVFYEMSDIIQKRLTKNKGNNKELELYILLNEKKGEFNKLANALYENIDILEHSKKMSYDITASELLTLSKFHIVQIEDKITPESCRIIGDKVALSASRFYHIRHEKIDFSKGVHLLIVPKKTKIESLKGMALIKYDAVPIDMCTYSRVNGDLVHMKVLNDIKKVNDDWK